MTESARTYFEIETKPKRPLSAYNFFFQNERKKLLNTMPTRPQGKPRRSHGKCGFAQMAKIIAKKWSDNEIDPKEKSCFEELVRKEKLRYKKEMALYKKRRVLKQRERKVTDRSVKHCQKAASGPTTKC